MMLSRFTIVVLLALAASLAGGCSQDNSGDAAATVQSVGLDRFLVFSNPQVQDDGSFQVVEQDYANAYYAAIDPAPSRATLMDFKTLNQFDSGTGMQHLVVFRDTHDLGSGRRMTGRRNDDGTLAFLVENYRVDAGSGLYTSVNVDAAAARDTRWLFNINAIEFSPLSGSPTTNCGNCVVKFYSYDPGTGLRQSMVDFDTRGTKAMPSICISCHGGRGDPLKADGSFPRTVTSLTLSGNTQARLHAFDVASFEYSTQAGFTRADQEAKLRDFNLWVLCSYPIRPTDPGYGTGINACRPDANPSEWRSQATANMIKVWYGDVEDGTNTPGSVFTGTYLPAGWVGHESLWNNVVAKYCRNCHIVRGNNNQSEIDFSRFDSGFENYKERTKAHVFDRGNMPLSLFVFQNFWNDSAAVNELANFLEDGSTTSGVSVPVRVGGVIPPVGRPVADPGPDRRVNSPATLSAASSLFASSFQWTVAAPCIATITAAASSSTTLTWTAGNGSACVVNLTVSNGAGQSHSKALTLIKDTSIPAVPTFADVRTIFTSCTGCHTHTRNPATDAGTPPIFFTDYDRGGAISSAGTAGDGTYTADTTDDDYWFYKELRGQVNLTDYSASPLLSKPTGRQHGGGLIFGVADSRYSVLVNWIVNGAPFQ